MAEVLSQSQIDALLNAVRSGEKDLNEPAEEQQEKKRLNMEVYIIAFRSVRKPPAPIAVRVRHATFTRAREPDIFTNDIRARPGP